MEKVNRLEFYIVHIYTTIQNCKGTLALYRELSNHCVNSPQTRELICDALIGMACLKISSIVKDDDSINIHKVKNILSSNWKEFLPNTIDSKNNVVNIVNVIDENLKDYYSVYSPILKWRDKLFAHVDTGWYDNNLFSVTQDKNCLTTYLIEGAIAKLEEMCNAIFTALNMDVTRFQTDSDLGKFIEIIKLGENALN